MNTFTLYDTKTASSPSGNLLSAVENMLGFIPNIFAVMAESTSALEAFVQLNYQFSASSFNTTEREVIQAAVSVENQCTYCVAGHTAFSQGKVPDAFIEAVRNNRTVPDKKLEALNQFVRSLVSRNGMISQGEIDRFIHAGYSQAQVLEVILGICVKVFSNFTNNAIGIPLDEQFSDYAWKPGR